MRESRTYGSVRGALSNERPYRDSIFMNENNGATNHLCGRRSAAVLKRARRPALRTNAAFPGNRALTTCGAC
jgi:hypothetical protein